MKKFADAIDSTGPEKTARLVDPQTDILHSTLYVFCQIVQQPSKILIGATILETQFKREHPEFLKIRICGTGEDARYRHKKNGLFGPH